MPKETEAMRKIIDNSLTLKECKKFIRLVETGSLRDGQPLPHISRVRTDLYVVRNKGGDALCIFEVEDQTSCLRSPKRSLFNGICTNCLKLPGYLFLYQRIEGPGAQPILNFNVRQTTPTKRYVGDLNPREFAGFLASTINHLRKKHDKENING